MTKARDEPDTRSRIRAASAELFARHGYAGTGLKHVSSAARAPFGSIYHFFPGGKDDLAEDMIRTSGPQFMQLVLDTLAERDDPAAALDHAFGVAADNLVAGDYADGCPIATMALDVASSNERLRSAAAEVFADWLEHGTAWFAGFVDDPARARDLANTLIMITEGAFLLSRAGRDPEPLYAAGRSMVTLVRSVVPSNG
ncbi:TetR/AcrR family transcriptional regulator [Microlunatus soli]|uniref:DNA-binding transcriptional regulator, AcrR family n=1 Tax=Microlunatus soli TaxID=630515 RepID=A0A1H1Y6X9_9ACTN|nr:TetR/AcrR family transcriptional regulator [Microlunatus soli]SDT17268.1 DNA-binding transcriptional regulator, AcrR family [Microlunatus soli]